MNGAVRVSIDGIVTTADAHATILEAADAAGVYIPRLCVRAGLSPHPDRQPCRLCVVGVAGRGVVLACQTTVAEGMQVSVQDPAAVGERRRSLADILARHPHACLVCAERDGCDLLTCSQGVPEIERCCGAFERCELRALADHIGVPPETPRSAGQERRRIRRSLFTVDPALCLHCLRCVVACRAQGHDAMQPGPAVGDGCAYCGACVTACPTGALMPTGDPWPKRDALRMPVQPRPPTASLPFDETAIACVPETGGVYLLLDGAGHTLAIGSGPNLREALRQRYASDASRVQRFRWEADERYSMRESELLQRYVARHGRLPPLHAEDDLY